jgi:hypothetical protein
MALEKQAAPQPEQFGTGGLPPGRDVALGNARQQGGDAITDLVRQWRDQVFIRANAQQLAAADDQLWNTALGVSTTLFAAVGASSLLSSTMPPEVAGLITLVAAALAGVQTVLRFGEKSGAHRGAAASYGRMKSRLDLLLARMMKGVEPPPEELDEHMMVLERLDTETPVVSEKYWKRAKARIAAGVVA